MSAHDNGVSEGVDVAPGDRRPGAFMHGLRGYLLGLALASGLTLVSFWAAGTGVIYQPAVPMALAVFSVAQMGIHLVFFLHITTDPDNTNNIMALAFGVLIVFLVVFGSAWIMSHLNDNMLPMDRIMQMQR